MVVKGKGVVFVMNVGLNEQVFSNNEGFCSMVHAFGNQNNCCPTVLTRIEMTDGATIDLTPDHMVCLVNKTCPIAVSSAQVGDVLRVAHMTEIADLDSGESKGALVHQVTQDIIKMMGFVTPIAASGTIVLNSVDASIHVRKRGSKNHFGDNDDNANNGDVGNLFSLNCHVTTFSMLLLPPSLVVHQGLLFTVP